MLKQSRNIIYSDLYLILVFFNGAKLVTLLGLDFLSIIFYMTVLFLFVVMKSNINLVDFKKLFNEKG